ncbi:MAG: hypothetical protein NWF06_11025 [Candidatus Bathyarchaeota archaeon]|nr:hypothetical protein [Candidatus Bathyarchaeum sp.]
MPLLIQKNIQLTRALFDKMTIAPELAPKCGDGDQNGSGCKTAN